jgi:hypothetical protein
MLRVGIEQDLAQAIDDCNKYGEIQDIDLRRRIRRLAENEGWVMPT